MAEVINAIVGKYNLKLCSDTQKSANCMHILAACPILPRQEYLNCEDIRSINVRNAARLADVRDSTDKSSKLLIHGLNVPCV